MKLLMLLDNQDVVVCVNPAAVKFMRISDIDRNDTLIYFVDGSHMHVKMTLSNAMNEFNKAME